MAQSQPQDSSKKERDKKSANYRKPITITAIVLVVLAVGLALAWPSLWPQIRNESFYSADKGETRADIEALLSQINTQGRPAYSDVVDLGCDSGGSVGLAKVISCEYAGYKYFVHQGDLSADLRSIDATLTREGWKRSPFSNQTSEELEQALDGTTKSSLRYQRDNRRVSVNLGYYKDGRQMNAYTIQELIEERKVPAPSSIEYIYGVNIMATYWACRDISIFKLPCPPPPSEARIRSAE